MIVIDPPRFNTIRLIESRLNRVHIGVSRFNRVSDHKYLNYRKRCGERYIHWKKERKEKRKEKKENASVTRKREIKRVKLFVYSPRLRSRDTSAILFGTYFQGARAQIIESASQGEVICRDCANSLLVLGLGHSGESGRSLCMVGHRIGDRRSRSRLSPFPEKCWVVEEQNKGNYVTIEQMSGVSCVETEPRYSAPWYPNIDVALMGIQSTAQFVEKYHHIIGKIYPFS